MEEVVEGLVVMEEMGIKELLGDLVEVAGDMEVMEEMHEVLHLPAVQEVEVDMVEMEVVVTVGRVEVGDMVKEQTAEANVEEGEDILVKEVVGVK